MKQIPTLFKHELRNYFTTHIAYTYILIFLIMSTTLFFNAGSFFERNVADLSSFFEFHPWLYLLLIPSICMHLWADERKSGTIELLMTLPVTCFEVVISKFMAAWIVATIALTLTFPVILTVNYLGAPDNGSIASGFFGSWLLSGVYIAVGSCMSATTRNQIIAYSSTLIICLLFTTNNIPNIFDYFSAWIPSWALDTLNSMSLLKRFDSLSRGIVCACDVLYIFSLMTAWIAATVVVIELKKSDQA